jgi:hypothetical protein
VGRRISHTPEGWPAQVPRDSELDLPLKINLLTLLSPRNRPPPPPSLGTQSGSGKIDGIEVIEVIDNWNERHHTTPSEKDALEAAEPAVRHREIGTGIFEAGKRVPVFLHDVRRQVQYVTNGNPDNGNHLVICLRSSQKNRNSLTWVLVALAVCFTYLYSTTRRNGNRLNGNHLEICLSSSQINRN